MRGQVGRLQKNVFHYNSMETANYNCNPQRLVVIKYGIYLDI